MATHADTPTVAAAATGAGSDATASVRGSDTAGTLTLTTASGEARRSHSRLLTVTFALAYAGAPVVHLAPANAAAWDLPPGTVRLLADDVTTTGFTLRSGRDRLPHDGATYHFTYQTTEV